MRSVSHRVLATVAVLVGIAPATLAAQQPTTVSGRVTGDAAAPLAGVAVSIPELSVGAHTDVSGKYSFTTPASAAGKTVLLVARRLGSSPDSARIVLTGDVTKDFQLKQSATQLGVIVTTALGIEKEKSKLGTAQQQINTEDLNKTKAMNLVQQVQGKISGVQITGSGTPGGSVAMVIRGQNTLTSDNQPLFIVDGIPVSNANKGGTLSNGYDFGNAISDLNSEDIETYTVLKGPNAAAIYGSRAQNGAVIITTKKGKSTGGRMKTEISTLYTYEAPGRLPDFQNKYGQGAGGAFEYADGAGGGTNDGADQSWGPRLDGRPICQFTSPGAGTSNCTPTPWVAHPNNVKDFFQTGHTLATQVAVSGGTDRANARMSIGNENTKGYIPNNFNQKTTGILTGALQVSPKFNTSATLQYIRNNGKNRPGTGYNNSILEQFFWFGRQVDVNALRDWRQMGAVNGGPDSREFNWNYNFHNNPFFTQEGNSLADSRDRVMVQGTAQYSFAPWLSAQLQSGSDIYRLSIDQKYSPAFLNGTFVDQNYQGGFAFTNEYNNEHNTTLSLNANHDFGSRITTNAMVAGQVRREQFNQTTTSTTGLSVADIYNVSNAAVAPTLGQTVTRRNMNSVYGSASATFDGYWTVEATGRQDVSSTLPKGNNTYFYPGVSSSLVLSEALPMLQNKYLSYLKLRGSWAEVGNDAAAYQLATTFAGNANKFGGRPQFSLGNNLLEPNLKPELTRSSEAGVEASFFDNRANIDLTAYTKETRNQIYLVPVSPTTGYANKLINAGTMRNTGLEALLTVTPVKLANGFEWTTTINYGQNKNKVVDLASGVERIVLGNGLFRDARLEATLDKPYGALWGYDLKRNDKGQILVDDDGIPVQTDTMVYLGSIQPKWTGGIGNEFRYKNVSVSGLFDIKRGGKIMSYTNYVGQYSGVLKESLKGREVDFDNPGVVVKGVNENTGAPNDVNITSETYFQSLFGATGQYMYDASYVKLRELSVGYQLPQRMASRLGSQAVSLALTGRNLMMWTKVPNVDPEFAYSSGNVQGIEYAFPGNTRSVGLSVRVTP